MSNEERITRYALCPDQCIRIGAGEQYVLLKASDGVWDIQKCCSGEISRFAEFDLLAMYLSGEMSFATVAAHPSSVPTATMQPPRSTAVGDRHALQVVDVCCRTMPVVVTDDRTSVTLGHPVVAVVANECTDALLGLDGGFGQTVLLGAIKNAALPKCDLAKPFPNIKHQLVCYGLPEAVRLPDMPEYHLADLERAAPRLGFQISYSKRRLEAGEAILDEISRMLLRACGDDSLATVIGPDICKAPSMKLSTLHLLLLHHAADVHMQRLVPRLNATPAQRWHVETSVWRPTLPACEADLHAAFGTPRPSIPRHYGLRVNGISYSSERLRDVACAKLSGISRGSEYDRKSDRTEPE